MKAKATKDKVQEELASTLKEQLGEHTLEIANASADRVLEIWQGFKRSHALVLKIAEGSGEFRRFLDSVAPQSLPRLDEVVGLLVPAEGEAGVLARLGDGTLNEAVNLMPAKALEIARDTGSVASALAWTKVAAGKLDQISDYDIHRKAKPQDFTSASLARILALDDRTAVSRLVGIDSATRDVLFSVSEGDLKVLAKNLSEAELTTLAGYLKGLEQAPREKVLKAVAESPRRMQVLASTRVRDAIIASTDQSAAVGMMLETVTGISPEAVARDLKIVGEGRVNTWLLLEKYPWLIALLAFVSLILLMMLRRLFRRPRHLSEA